MFSFPLHLLYNNDYFLDRKDDVIILCGPTGTGKTSFSVLLAGIIDAEVINCDMAQIYTEGKIGTGQISCNQMFGVVHHLIDFLDTPISISVYQMRVFIEKKIEEILSRKKRIIIVGGSMFCIFSLFFAPGTFYKNNLPYYSSLLSPEKIFSSQSSVFSGSSKFNDAIFFCPLYSYCIIYFDCICRLTWKNIVRKRIDSFFDDGIISEIFSMDASWRDFLFRKKIIGYYQILSKIDTFVDGHYNNELSPIKDLIFFSTVQYGKKQRTFMRKMYRDLSFYNVINIFINF